MTTLECHYTTANPHASKWTAGFRRIFVHPLARTIQIEFVGAPAHYCFEAYEVRLKDETGLDLLYSSIIPVEAMRSEVIDNNTVLFGEYNFTDLEVDDLVNCFITYTKLYNNGDYEKSLNEDFRLFAFQKCNHFLRKSLSELLNNVRMIFSLYHCDIVVLRKVLFQWN
uniref:BTB domain-containing protein n=1 Tax=Ascaris lumbricoides TaxID=6252 RepID=A0A0M3HLV3_ASCLU